MPKQTPRPETPPLIPAESAPPCLYLRLRLASRRLLTLYEARLAPSGVSMSQFGLLIAIAEEPELTISRLAEKRELAPSTLTRTLRPMEEAGWIESSVDDANRRVRRLRLSKEGHTRLRASFACWKQAQAEAAAVVSAKAVAQILHETERLAR